MVHGNGAVLDTLLASDEPSIRWKTRVEILGEDPQSKPIRALRNQVRASPRVTTLLKHRDSFGRIMRGRSVYDKWRMEGRHRRCASQGYALSFIVTLGLENARVHDLVERLMHWRWPDGGWNCDSE